MLMPHGSDKSPEKNRNEIRHMLCVPYSNEKWWLIIKQMTYKNLSIVKKIKSSVQNVIYRRLITKDCVSNTGVLSLLTS